MLCLFLSITSMVVCFGRFMWRSQISGRHRTNKTPSHSVCVCSCGSKAKPLCYSLSMAPLYPWMAPTMDRVSVCVRVASRSRESWCARSAQNPGARPGAFWPMAHAHSNFFFVVIIVGVAALALPRYPCVFHMGAERRRIDGAPFGRPCTKI